MSWIFALVIIAHLSLVRESQGQPQPQTSSCTTNDWSSFLSTLPNAATCRPSVIAVLQFVTTGSDAHDLPSALENACNLECGGAFATYLTSTCNDSFTAELLELYCTFTNGTSTLGSYCRLTALDVFNKSLLRDLFLCHPITPGVLCSPVCKQLLLEVKSQLGCCYQSLFNNSAILDNLHNSNFLPVVQYYGLQRLREPTFNVWMVCNVPPPEQCKTSPFSSMIPPSPNFVRPPASCALDYIFTLPHAQECGLSLSTAFQPTTTDKTIIINDLENVCNSDCGGNYAEHLKSMCKDDITAEVLKIICTPAGNDSAVGPYCRFSYGTLYNQTTLVALFSSCSSQHCAPECRAGLLKFKSEVGCCYQTIYNNTHFLNITFDAGLISPEAFFGMQSIGNPTANPWMACNIESPQVCDEDPFPAIIPSPICSLDNWVGFISQLPNAIECGPNVATIFSPPRPANQTLAQALDTVCIESCGGVLNQYLATTCNDLSSSQLLKLYCTPTLGGAAVGPRCRFASPDINNISTIIGNVIQSCNITTANARTCTAECREALVNLKSELGCCYQSMYNNSLLLKTLSDAGFITAKAVETIEYLRNPLVDIWTTCRVTVPKKCLGDPFPVEPDCPPTTYKDGFTCRPCPANSNTSASNMPICPCLKGFFRSVGEGPANGCSLPPSSCLNIGLMNKTDEQVSLYWNRPRLTGRSDFYYTITYSDGETVGEHSLRNGLDAVEEIISGLTPATRYTFTVTVHNGVSSQDSSNEHLRRCELTTTTEEGRPSAPLDVQGFCSVIGWRMPSRPSGELLSYDVHLYSSLTNDHEDVLATVNSDQTYFALGEDQHMYKQSDPLVQVRARTRAGPGEWSKEVPLGCESSTQEPMLSGVYFIHKGQSYANNSNLSLTSIGKDQDALICKTDKEDCCATPPNRVGEFYYPGGVQVPIRKLGGAFYRTRGNQEIYLNRRAGFNSPSGVFRCDIPNSSGMMQTIYITLYA